MATDIDLKLHLPLALMEEVATLAAEDAVSVNDFLTRAAAEKVAAIKQRRYLDDRRKRAIPGDFSRLLEKAGSPISIPGDELPEGWPGSTA